MNTPTPRTDSEEYPEGEGQSFHVVSADFARTLERELAAEREKVRTLREALGRIEDAADKHSFGGDMLAWAGDVATAALAIAATKEGAK
jgi:hypothetical protein